MKTLFVGRKGFSVLVGVLLVAYFGLQVLYISRLPVVMDEFQESSTLGLFEQNLPYRDFPPYKTVLGHYLQLGPFALGRGSWGKILSVKLALALLNTMALGLAVGHLSRAYAKTAVFGGLLLTIPVSNFLERSSDFRVDMLTSWAGLASLLLLLNSRFAAAGLAAGLSFLISQKGIYFCIAGAAALGLSLLLGSPGRRELRSLARFVLGATTAVALYVGFWAIFAGLEAVLVVMFWAPRRMAVAYVYGAALEMWAQTISRNPMFYGLAVLGIIRFVTRPWRESGRAREQTLGLYALVLGILAASNPQPWPYFFVLVIPTGFVLIVALLHTHHRQRGDWSPLGPGKLIVGLCIAFGVLLPLSRIPVNLQRDNGHQRQAVELAEHVLAPDEMYIAGVDMVYGRKQPVTILRWIDYPKMQMLHQMPPAALASMIDTLRHSRLKVAIDNYRLAGLPAALRDYLAAETTPLWGNVRIYAPMVGAGDTTILLKFAGRYEVQAPPDGIVNIDGRTVSPGAVVGISAGPHKSLSAHAFRLKLLPEGWASLADEAYRAHRDFFPNVYGY